LAVSQAETQVESLLAQLLGFSAAVRAPISPHALAMDFFCGRLSEERRKLMSLACASRVAPFVDAAVAAIPELCNGKAEEFTLAVDQAFSELRNGGTINSILLLQKFRALLRAGIISEAQGGQGESLVEEVLTPAMQILAAVLSEDGMTVIHLDEERRVLNSPSYESAKEVCRIATALADPGKFPESDEGGIPPWFLESTEVDAQWKTIELLQSDVELARHVESVQAFAFKCRKQNMRLTERSAEYWRSELLASRRNV
jgi:hypothetical protein